jgi:hypothetical protein
LDNVNIFVRFRCGVDPYFHLPVLGDMEIKTCIQGVLAHGVHQNFGSSPVPLREGVNTPWVSLLELTFIYLCQFLFLNACSFLHRISGMHAAPSGEAPYLRMW